MSQCFSSSCFACLLNVASRAPADVLAVLRLNLARVGRKLLFLFCCCYFWLSRRLLSLCFLLSVSLMLTVRLCSAALLSCLAALLLKLKLRLRLSFLLRPRTWNALNRASKRCSASPLGFVKPHSSVQDELASLARSNS